MANQEKSGMKELSLRLDFAQQQTKKDHQVTAQMIHGSAAGEVKQPAQQTSVKAVRKKGR